MGSREGDTAVWLHNKLGSTDDLWSGRSICSQLTVERLQDIVQCFRTLQPHVKVKLLLSLLHIVRRNVDEWKSDLEEIIHLATSDRDQWVSTIGEILKTYPSSLLVNYTDLSGSTTFHSMYTELKKLLKKSSEVSCLPLECMCLGKNALNSTINHIPSNQKHFNLKRKSKSSALRADLLMKSQDLQQSSKKGLPMTNIPMKVRSTAKRMDEEIANTKTPSSGGLTRSGSLSSSSSSSAGFLKANTLSSYSSSQRQTSSLAMRKEGGAKMLDISEMPPTGREAKKRKKLEEQEAAAQAKKEKEEAAAAAERAAAASKATPDYAAGLGGNAAIKSVLPGTQRSAAAAVVTTPSYLPNVASRVPAPLQAGYNRDMVNHTVVAQPPSSTHFQTVVAGPVPHSVGTTTVQKVRLPSASQPQPTPQVVTSAVRPTQINIQQLPVQPPAQRQPSSQPPPQQQQQQQAAQPAKKPLSLTKELMQEAQEMFRNSNKVSRPEKALILGFMAGSRDNPCPDQGHIVNIRLSENVEAVRLQDNSVREILMETFFQMNYQTGEWKRIKKPKESFTVMTGLAQVIK